MKKLVEDWIYYAENDLNTAKILIEYDTPITSSIAFHCQQAIEKYLKAYLVDNEIPIIKTHDLVKLDGIIKKIKALGIDKEKLMTVNEVYSETRYPGDIGLLPDGLPSVKQVQEFLEFANEVKAIILKELNPENTDNTGTT